MDEAVFDEMTARVSHLYIAASTLDNFSYRLANGLDINLEGTIWQLLSRQATDPSDVIYALLGILTERSIIEIDYGKSKWHVYKSAMKHMLERSRDGLAPFQFLQESRLVRDITLPSWVPDFGILHAFKTTNLATTGIGIVLTRGSLYNACLGDAGWNPPKFLVDDDVLQVEGVSVDEVKDLGDVCPKFPDGWEQREAQLRGILDQWRKLVPKQDEDYIAGGSVIEAFWRTVTFDLLLKDREYFAGNPNRIDVRLPRRVLRMIPTVEEEVEIREGIVDAPPPKIVLEKLGERRFFVTKGGYFGLGPASMQDGDMICVLRGSLFPTLIRPATNDRYLIVGEW